MSGGTDIQASPVFVLRFAFSLIHGSGRAAKKNKKQGRPGNTYDMNDVNDVRWTRGGHGGEEGSAIKYNILDFIIEPPVARKDPRHSHKIVSTPLDQ